MSGRGRPVREGEMASIDKIYATKAQHDQFRAWCTTHMPVALEYFYDWLWDDDDTHPITNFPEYMDAWMWRNCPIAFVRERIGEQYNVASGELG